MFGSHVSIESTLGSTLAKATQQGMNAIQVFMGSPYNLNRKQLTTKDIQAVNDTYSSTQVFTHLPYVYNYAGQAKNNSIAFQSDEDATKYVLDCAAATQRELQTLHPLKCSCKGCVLHIGSIGKHKDRQAGLNAVARSINSINFDNISTPLLLETMVGRGGVLGTSFEELGSVYSQVEHKDQVGFCIDTCHIHSNGSYNLSSIEGVESMFKDFDSVLPHGSLKLIHLNDSRTELGSNQDKHECIGKGSIWSESQQSLKLICQIAKQRDVPVVLETTVEDFQVLNELVKKL